MLAWPTLEAMRAGAESESGPWHEFVNGLLCQHVAFVVPDERLAQANPEWWSEVVGHALTQFVRENGPVAIPVLAASRPIAAQCHVRITDRRS